MLHWPGGMVSLRTAALVAIMAFSIADMPSSAQSDEPRIIEITAHRFAFEPAAIEATVGERLQAVISRIKHNSLKLNDIPLHVNGEDLPAAIWCDALAADDPGQDQDTVMGAVTWPAKMLSRSEFAKIEFQTKNRISLSRAEFFARLKSVHHRREHMFF